MLIHRSPEPMRLASDGDHNLVEMPYVSGCRKTPADLVGEALAELQRPLPDCLMTDQDPAGSQHLLHHPEAEREPKIKPDGMADHFRWEPVAGVAKMARRFHPSPMPRSGHPLVNLTMPFREDRFTGGIAKKPLAFPEVQSACAAMAITVPSPLFPSLER